MRTKEFLMCSLSYVQLAPAYETDRWITGSATYSSSLGSDVKSFPVKISVTTWSSRSLFHENFFFSTSSRWEAQKRMHTKPFERRKINLASRSFWMSKRDLWTLNRRSCEAWRRTMLPFIIQSHLRRIVWDGDSLINIYRTDACEISEAQQLSTDSCCQGHRAISSRLIGYRRRRLSEVYIICEGDNEEILL